MSFTKFEELLEIKTNHFTKQLKHSDLTDDMQSHQIFSKNCVLTISNSTHVWRICTSNIFGKYTPRLVDYLFVNIQSYCYFKPFNYSKEFIL